MKTIWLLQSPECSLTAFPSLDMIARSIHTTYSTIPGVKFADYSEFNCDGEPTGHHWIVTGNRELDGAMFCNHFHAAKIELLDESTHL